MEKEQIRGIIENIQKELDLIKSLVCGKTKQEEGQPYDKHMERPSQKRQNG